MVLAASGSITKRSRRSSRSYGLSAMIGPLIIPQEAAQDVERVFERHAIKAVAALAVFVEDRPHRIEHTHSMGKVGGVVLLSSSIHISITDVLLLVKFLMGPPYPYLKR